MSMHAIKIPPLSWDEKPSCSETAEEFNLGETELTARCLTRVRSRKHKACEELTFFQRTL